MLLLDNADFRRWHSWLPHSNRFFFSLSHDLPFFLPFMHQLYFHSLLLLSRLLARITLDKQLLILPDSHSSPRQLHTHDISFALQIYQEYSTDITTLLSCQSSKSIRVRITRLSQPTSNSLKHLTWGCLLAAQPQSLSVGVTISLLLSLRDYAWFWRMIIACLPVCSPPPCPDGGDEGGWRR